MTSTSVALKDVDGIDALEVQIRESIGMNTNNLVMRTILEISNEIPSNANAIDSSYAEYLAGKFLKGVELCGDVASMAFRYEHQMETLKRKEFSTAYLVRAPLKGYKRAKDQEFYAFQDEEYLKVCEKLGIAKAFKIMITQKHSAFEKAHHMMRKISEQHGDGLAEKTKLTSESGNSFDLKDTSRTDEVDWEQALRD